MWIPHGLARGKREGYKGMYNELGGVRFIMLDSVRIFCLVDKFSFVLAAYGWMAELYDGWDTNKLFSQIERRIGGLVGIHELKW